MNKSEAKFQGEFFNWLKNNPPMVSTAYEYKYVKGNTFNIKQWKKKHPHQIRGLLNASNNWMYHKISDQSMGQKPFDAFVMANAEAYLVIFFGVRGKFCVLEINSIIDLIENNKSIRFNDVDPKFIFSIKTKKAETIYKTIKIN